MERFVDDMEIKERYLKDTSMLNYKQQEIQHLIHEYGWTQMDDYHKIKGIYEYVRNQILFGYNCSDLLSATTVLQDGIGQCNTKGTLLMALLRAVGIPCRLHGFEVKKDMQQGATSGLISILAPYRIIHTWVEAYYQRQWCVLEGVITDQNYLDGIKRMFPGYQGSFMKYGIAVKRFEDIDQLVDWNGGHTWIQSEAVITDFGVFDTPDDFFAEHGQHLNLIKNFLYVHYGTKKMTRNVQQIRNLVR